MNEEDAVPIDMRQLLAFLRPMPPVLDEDTADRLLTGRLDPADAPPGYAGVARLLAVAAAPAAPEELAGQAAAVARFAAEVESHPPTPIPRRTGMPSRMSSVKVTAVVSVVVLSVSGVAAAATGLLPSPARWVAEQVSSTSHASSTSRGQGDPGTAAPDSPGLDKATTAALCQAWQAGQGASNGNRADSAAFRALATAAGGADKVAAYCQAAADGGTATSSKGQGTPTGPDAAGAAKAGLCRAWQAGQGGSNGRRDDSVAFRALAAAAGGVDKIPAFCETTTSTSAHGQSAEPHGNGKGPSSPPTTLSSPAAASPSASGPPSSTGHGGQGQGGPPTTG